jgi:hypothetical protein
MRELGPADSSARGDTTMTLLFDSRSRGSCANGFKHRLYRALLTFVRCQNDGAGTVLRQGAARAAEQYIRNCLLPSRADHGERRPRPAGDGAHYVGWEAELHDPLDGNGLFDHDRCKARFSADCGLLSGRAPLFFAWQWSQVRDRPSRRSRLEHAVVDGVITVQREHRSRRTATAAPKGPRRSAYAHALNREAHSMFPG